MICKLIIAAAAEIFKKARELGNALIAGALYRCILRRCVMRLLGLNGLLHRLLLYGNLLIALLRIRGLLRICRLLRVRRLLSLGIYGRIVIILSLRISLMLRLDRLLIIRRLNGLLGLKNISALNRLLSVLLALTEIRIVIYRHTGRKPGLIKQGR